MTTFIDYCMSFYGSGGLYDIGATPEELAAALEIRRRDQSIPFDGDSVDREMVRDILLLQREQA
jgi:hypothetical protein